MALVHDMAEAITGDLTPDCGVGLEEKAALETKAFSTITSMLALCSTTNKGGMDSSKTINFIKILYISFNSIWLVWFDSIHSILIDLITVEGGRWEERWREYAADKSPEAQFTKDLDKFEFVVQAMEYARRHPEIDLEDFVGAGRSKVRQPMLSAILDRLCSAAKTPIDRNKLQ